MDGITPGRIVHYVMPVFEGDELADKGRHRSAVITDVAGGDTVHLNVNLSPRDIERTVNGSPVLVVEDVPYDEAGTPKTWHWIERA